MEETRVATTPDVQRAVSKRFDELAWALKRDKLRFGSHGAHSG